MRLHDARHAYAPQGVMKGVGLTAVGKLPGHRKRATTAIYAHLDDAALRDPEVPCQRKPTAPGGLRMPL